MKLFEYRCKSCNTEIVTPFYLETDEEWGHIEWHGADEPELLEHAQCGPLKRRWSFGIAWPVNERGHD